MSFGGVLFTGSVTNLGASSPTKYVAYWNRLVIDGYNGADDTVIYFDDPNNCVDAADSSRCSKCTSGGKGLIAMQVFAFIGLTFCLFFSFIRVLGVHISALEPTRKVLFFEFFATGNNALWFFLSVCVYGGTCFHAASGVANNSITGTGFGYIICCFFFLIFNAVIIYNIRSDSTTHLGSSAAGTDYTNETDANSTHYTAPTTNYQYNPDAAAYSASYGNDVIPATGQQQQAQAGDNNL